MRTASNRFFLLFVIFLLPVTTADQVFASSQSEVSKDIQYWAYYSQGISTLGYGNTIGVAIEYNKHVFSIRTSATDLEPFKDTWDIGFLYGRSVMIQSVFLSAAAGPSVIAGNQYNSLSGGTLEESMDPMIGFAVGAEASIPFTPFTAFGIYTSLNINTNQPIGSIGAILRIGNVR